MLPNPISEIGIYQILRLIPFSLLGEIEQKLIYALKFKMPTLEDIFIYAENNIEDVRNANPMYGEKYVLAYCLRRKMSKKNTEKELNKYRAEYNSLNAYDKIIIRWNYYYFMGHKISLQRRIIRYASMILAMEGFLSINQYR